MHTHNPNRRRFLRQSTGAAASALLVPYFLTGRSARADQSKEFNVGSIGVGGRGSEIGKKASAFANIVACADVDSQKSATFAGQFEEKCQEYEDYRHILDRKDIDAITCGTPDQWHTRIAIDAMRAGKDVYCEKPLTLTIDESRQICKVTKETGRVFQVGTQQRSEYSQYFLKAVAIAHSGRLGDQLHAISSVGQPESGGPFPTETPPDHLNFDLWLGQAPTVDYCPERVHFHFRWWLEYSGGQITDWGAHHTDIALWALGGDQTGIVEAEGTGVFPGLSDTVNPIDFLNGRVKLPNQNNVARDFDCHLNLPNGNTINLTSKTNEIIISGEKGRIRVNRGGLTGEPVEEIASDPAASEKLDEQVRKLYRNMPFSPVDPERLGHMGNFFHCIKTREMPISDVWSHGNAINACHAANIAMLLKRKLTFDPQNHRFAGDDEANQLVRRVQRSPWEIDA